MKGIIIKVFGVILLVIFLVYLFYSPKLEFDVLENPNKSSTDSNRTASDKTSKTSSNPTLKSGIGTFIGQPIESVIEKYGQPDRTYTYLDKYQTYIYHQKNKYLIILTKGKTVKSAYVTGKDSKNTTGPIEIDDDASKLYNAFSINTEPQFKLNRQTYHFELSDVDVKTQALIQFGDIYAQVFIDQHTNRIVGVRYLDKETLVDVNPYSEQNDDTLNESKEDEAKATPSSEQTQNQLLTLYELTNEMRKLYQMDSLEVNPTLENVATMDLFDVIEGKNQAFSENDLTDLMSQTQLTYQSVSQNVGYDFNDVPTVVHSWLNSDSHRTRMLNSLYNQMGGEVDRGYYTLIFLEEGES